MFIKLTFFIFRSGESFWQKGTQTTLYQDLDKSNFNNK